MSNLRFRTPMIASRPGGKRVIEAFSPKLGRRLQCFGEDAYGQWICLEADPAVETFCERPLELELTDGSRRPADFWVRHDDCEMLLIVDGESTAFWQLDAYATLHDFHSPGHSKINGQLGVEIYFRTDAAFTH